MNGRSAGVAWQHYYVIVVAMVQVSHTMPTSEIYHEYTQQYSINPRATPSGLLIIASCIRNKSLVGMVYLLHVQG